MNPIAWRNLVHLEFNPNPNLIVMLCLRGPLAFWPGHVARPKTSLETRLQASSASGIVSTIALD